MTLTPSPASATDLASRWNHLYTPVVGDVLDALGYSHQFLPPAVQPMRTGMKLAGRAMPALMADVYGPQDKPFGLLTEALDQLEPGEVYLCAGGALRCAYWGEILTATAKARGAVGAVIDGYHRDTPKVLEQDWPVFSRGRFAQDSAVRTKVIDYRVPIEVGGVSVTPGDLVFADLDGVLVIPQQVEEEVFDRATEKARAEDLVRAAIENGMSSTDAFATYGVL
jgi:regulator of RNase E activity RraA